MRPGSGSAGARGHGSRGSCAEWPGRRFARVRAFTLVEVILTILIVGVGLVASMRLLPVILRASKASREALVAQQLATDLLAEIALLPFEDPDGPIEFGPETGEDTGTRALFDDVDDYHSWTSSPPQKKDGTTETGCTGYTRSVVVTSVDPHDFNRALAPGSTDAKSIVVTVSKPGMRSVTLTSVRLKGANREDPD